MTWQDYLDREQDRFVEELADFVRIPSVSAKPEHEDDVRAAADWVATRMTAAKATSTMVKPARGLLRAPRPRARVERADGCCLVLLCPVICKAVSRTRRDAYPGPARGLCSPSLSGDGAAWVPRL